MATTYRDGDTFVLTLDTDEALALSGVLGVRSSTAELDTFDTFVALTDALEAVEELRPRVHAAYELAVRSLTGRSTEAPEESAA